MLEELQDSLDYIDDNIEKDLSISDVAYNVGYSKIHYSRVFREYFGLSVNNYIQERKLIFAIWDILNSEKAIDVAIKYGFSSYSGFYRSFKKKFRCAPKKYIQKGLVNKPEKVSVDNLVNEVVTRKTIVKVLKHWEFDDIILNIETRNFHYYHQFFIVDLNDEYILKTGTNINWVKNQCIVSQHLVNFDVNIPLPINTINGDPYIVENERFFMVMKKISGNCLNFKNPDTFDYVDNGNKIGVALANLHLLLRKTKLNGLNESNLSQDIVNWALPNSLRIMSQWEFDMNESFSQFIKDSMSLVEQLPKQVIHRDPNPFKVLFKENEVTGFIDFDLAEKNTRMFDVSYMSTGVLLELFSVDKGFEIWFEMFKSILHGYHSINPISELEAKSIPSIMYSIELIVIAYLENKPECNEMAINNMRILHLLWCNHERIVTVIESLF